MGFAGSFRLGVLIFCSRGSLIVFIAWLLFVFCFFWVVYFIVYRIRGVRVVFWI